MSDELLQAMWDAFTKTGDNDFESMRAVLDVLHAHGYRRCAEGQRVTQWCDRAEKAEAEVNEFRRVLRSVVRYDVGYEWDGTKMCHTPLIKIEFSDVPAGEPNTALGWLDRDAFSASIDAARGES